MNIPSLFTDRLALRPLVQADASNLHRIYQMEGVLRYFPGQPPPPFESVERYITGQEKHWEKYGYGNWGILPSGQNEIIGWTGLHFLPELDETEVGFILSPSTGAKATPQKSRRLAFPLGLNSATLRI